MKTAYLAHAVVGRIPVIGLKTRTMGFSEGNLDENVVGPAGFTLDRARQSKFFGMDG